MTSPRPLPSPVTGFAFLDEPRRAGRVVAMAHRGGALLPRVVGRENTLAAFRVAAGLGFGYLETDAHATRDGVLLAFHDHRLDRLTGRPGRIRDLTAAEVAGLRVGGTEPVPRLEDVLEELPGIRLNVDLKVPGAVEPMVDLLRRTGAVDRFCVASFHEPSLRRFRARAAAEGLRVATAAGVLAVVALAATRHAPARLSRPLLRCARDTGTVLQVPHRRGGVRVVDAAFVRRAHSSGRHVHVWTVDERAEMEALLDLGVDGLITDRPDVLRDVLLERGQWEGPT